ncbi:hypothetical protein [Streptomyces sp. NPDC005828]|uniref:hypothetical protein n=1 Tax=Streptomyces sp. NPDC005828 TaxID=3157071 RepID=UPI0033CF7930
MRSHSTRITARRILLPAAAFAMVAAGCAQGTDEAAPPGQSAAEVCGGFATVYFTCRLEAPAHEIVLDAELERADGNGADHPGIRDEQITLANAAAAHVAAELGCAGTGPVTGVPATERS